MDAFFTGMEEALIATIKDHFGNTLAKVDGMSGALNADSLSSSSTMLPGVYIQFIRLTAGKTRGQKTTKWVLFPITGSAAGSKARRKGSKNKMGMHDLIEQLLWLDEKPLKLVEKDAQQNEITTGFGTIKLGTAQELFAKKTKDKGALIWSVELSVDVAMPNEPNTLDAFETFNADTTIEGATANDKIELEQ